GAGVHGHLHHVRDEALLLPLHDRLQLEVVLVLGERGRVALLDGHAQVYDPHGDSSPEGTGQCLTAFYARRWRFCLLQAGDGCRLSPGRTRGIMAPASEPDPREDAMDVGLQMIFASYGWSGVSDEQVWDEELRLARLAADHGFDMLWSVEHHFNDYSFCPDNLQLMSYLA